MKIQSKKHNGKKTQLECGQSIWGVVGGHTAYYEYFYFDFFSKSYQKS